MNKEIGAVSLNDLSKVIRSLSDESDLDSYVSSQVPEPTLLKL